MIKVEHANKTFSGKYGKVHALQEVSIHVEKGDIYGIIGFSGAGKSTLIRLVNGLETLDSGTVTVHGEELGSLKKPPLRKLRRKIGMVFQQFNLLESKTVYHNIALPLILEKVPKAEIDKKVKEVLQFVELEDKKDVYVSHVSGGQPYRKRLYAWSRTIRGTNKNHYICTDALQRRLSGRQRLPAVCREQGMPLSEHCTPW